jgi:hypothetical protein
MDVTFDYRAMITAFSCQLKRFTAAYENMSQRKRNRKAGRLDIERYFGSPAVSERS